jgi:sigma-54 dependent transcriptional regulator, acetoin dehydrogenase operon transcriptional activator AcoR
MMPFAQAETRLDLTPAWEAFMRDGRLATMVPPPVGHSWQRCAARGLHWHPHLEQSLSEEMRAALPLIRPQMEDLHQYIEGAGTLILCADVHCVIGDGVGDRDVAEALQAIGITPGACWDEETCGTNALALAMIEAAPVAVTGAAHYVRELHPYFEAAAPIFDGLGLPIGVIAVVGQRDDCHPHSLGMVTAAAQAITNQLQTNLWLSAAQERLSELSTMVQTLSEGVMLLTGDSVVSRINSRAAHMLGLAPLGSTGRRLHDLLAVPPSLAQALAQGRELHDEEIPFQVHGARVSCLCTLRVITAPPASMGALLELGNTLVVPPTAEPVSGFVLSLRPLERVQRLVHRMAGAQARMTFADIAGSGPAITEAIRLARIAASSASTVLLRGETGAGKDLFAQSIHMESDRAPGPFVAINCAAIPRELITSELFGYEGGSFTGADRQGRPGKFELAHGGTLFLDEIGDMPRDLQTSLLRALETRTITRIGGQQVISVDVRIIAATHKSLEDDVASGAFRQDLFYRLNVFPITVPPLRERREDIPTLLYVILRRHSQALGRGISVDPAALAAILAYPWPGNVRELENTLERLAYIAEGGVIRVTDLPPTLHPGTNAPLAAPIAPSPAFPTLHGERAKIEADAIRRALETSNGRIDEAARLLGISRTTLWRHRARLHKDA